MKTREFTWDAGKAAAWAAYHDGRRDGVAGISRDPEEIEIMCGNHSVEQKHMRENDEKADDRCFCADCLSENPVVFDFGDDCRPAPAPATHIAGFVVCVNDEPYPDTFSEDASITWQLFLPILEADPGLGNEDVRLVRLTEE